MIQQNALTLGPQPDQVIHVFEKFPIFSTRQYMAPGSEDRHTSIIKDMISGAIGMSTASAVLNPLDVVKVRMQQSGSTYTGLSDCAKRSVKASGVIKGLVLPGLTATIMRDVLNGAFRVGLYKEIERWLFPADTAYPFLVRKLVTGVIVGGIGAGLWSHTDLVKTRMQTQSVATPAYRSTLHAYSALVRTSGLRGLYQGVGTNMFRASIITTVHVGSYEYLKTMVSPIVGEGGVAWLLCGFGSALITTTAFAPVDLIRTRVMLDTSHHSRPLTVARTVVRADGIRGLFRGWLPSFYRFGPHFTLSWPLIELSRKHIFSLEPFYPLSHKSNQHVFAGSHSNVPPSLAESNVR